jgi:predicted amidohydrolase
LKLGVYQMVVTENIDANTDKIIQALKQSAYSNIDIVAFPEMSLTGYSPELLADDDLNLKIRKAITKIEKAADHFGVAAIIGHPYRNPRKKVRPLYNRATAILPGNHAMQFCDKIHPVEEEQRYFSAGKAPLLLTFKQNKIGVIICRDQNYPEIARDLVNQGARFLYILSAHYYSPKTARWKVEKNRAIPITRAVENKVHVLMSNSVGAHLGMISLGNSIIVDPDGAVVVSAGESEEALLSVSTDSLHF